MSDEIDEALDRLASSMARQAPLSRQPEVRRLVLESLGPRVREFGDQGIACLMLPSTPAVADPIRPAITFTPIINRDLVDPVLMLQALAGGDPTATLVEIEGLVAVRTHATVDATQAAEEAQPLLDELLADPDVPKVEIDAAQLDLPEDLRMVSSRVRYTMGDPDDRDKWIDVQMAVDHPTTPEAEELAQGVIELFDAVISTFRWDA